MNRVFKPGEVHCLMLIASGLDDDNPEARELYDEMSKLSPNVKRIGAYILKGGKGRGADAETARVIIQRTKARNVSIDERQRRGHAVGELREAEMKIRRKWRLTERINPW